MDEFGGVTEVSNRPNAFFVSVKNLLFFGQRDLHFASTKSRVGCPSFAVKFSLTLAAVLFLPCAFLSAAEVEGTEPSVSVTPLNFQHETLPNGLEFYSVADHSSPTVAVKYCYRLWTMDDPAQGGGYADLL